LGRTEASATPRTIKLLGIETGRGGQTRGAEDGPAVLRRRGLVDRLRRGGHVVEDLGDVPGVDETHFARGVGRSVNYLHNVLQVNRHTYAAVRGTLRAAPEAFLLVIGGDHSLAIGTLAGLADSCRRLGILWIDAHADFNTPVTSPSGNIHGMSLAVACGHGHRDLMLIAERDPIVDEDDVYLLGPRDVDPGERANLQAARVHVLSTEDWRSRGLAQAVLDAREALRQRCDRIHLSFDIDVLDPGLVPGTGTPSPGGLGEAEARTLLAALGGGGGIASAEFVEFNPHLDREGRTAELTLTLIEALLCGG
jgi:arginase